MKDLIEAKRGSWKWDDKTQSLVEATSVDAILAQKEQDARRLKRALKDATEAYRLDTRDNRTNF